MLALQKIVPTRYLAITAASVVVVAWSLVDSTSAIVAAEDPLSVSGDVSAHLSLSTQWETGKHFEITDSNYANFTMDSSEEISVYAKSIPETITVLIDPISPATSTQIILTGLAPLTTYHKFEDNYHNPALLTTDEKGKYRYVQDISKRHLIFIQPHASTKFILNGPDGGDCALIGTWSTTTKTCTLTTDLAESIQIDGNGITLDGGGHTMVGNNAGAGILVSERNDITVQNITVTRFSTGIQFFSSDTSAVDNTNVLNNADGVRFGFSNNNKIVSSTIHSTQENAISLNISHENSITRIQFTSATCG